MIVFESIEKYLTPKSKEDIDKSLNNIINDFVNKVSIRDFNKAINDFREIKDTAITINKENGKTAYYIDEDAFIGIIEYLVITYDEFKDVSLFPEMSELWYDLSKDSIDNEYKETEFDKIKNILAAKIANKFNVFY